MLEKVFQYKTRIVVIISIICALVILFSILYAFAGRKIDSPEVTCWMQENKIVDGTSMEPMVKNGSEIKLLSGYYKCRPVEKGQVVAYKFAGRDVPIIKIVKATCKDNVEIEGNKVKINGEFMKNSAGMEYDFSTGELNMIALYIKDGKIPEDSYLIFGDNVEDSLDSRKFGSVSASDFLGRFKLN